MADETVAYKKNSLVEACSVTLSMYSMFILVPLGSASVVTILTAVVLFLSNFCNEKKGRCMACCSCTPIGLIKSFYEYDVVILFFL